MDALEMTSPAIPLDPPSGTMEASKPVATFAEELADYFVSQQGYERGTPPEASALYQDCDIVLSRHLVDGGNQGTRLRLICIVDGERTPGKMYDHSADDLRDIMMNCANYTDESGVRNSRSVSAFLIEIHKHPIRKRFESLKSFKPLNEFDQRELAACVVNCLSGECLSTNRLLGANVASLLKQHSLSDADRARLAEDKSRNDDAQKAIAAVKFRPGLTFALLALMALVFLGELYLNLEGFPKDLTPSIKTLVALGGNFQPLTVGEQEWFRLWTAIFMHGNVVHILLNGVALFLAGIYLEPLLGRLHFFALFMIGGLCGSLASVFWNPANLVSTGASGAITACFGAMITIAFHYPAGPVQTRLIQRSIQILLPAVLPFLNVKSGMTIDYADHIGGAIGGVVIGGAWLLTWPKQQPRPGGYWISMVAAVVGVAGLMWGVVGISTTYAERARMEEAIQQLAPQTAFGTLWKQSVTGNTIYLDRYPADPRSHISRAIYLFDRKNYPDAEQEIKDALAQDFILKKVLAPAVRAQASTILAMIRLQQGHRDEAENIAGPICDVKTGLEQILQNNGLCPKP